MNMSLDFQDLEEHSLLLKDRIYSSNMINENEKSFNNKKIYTGVILAMISSALTLLIFSFNKNQIVFLKHSDLIEIDPTIDFSIGDARRTGMSLDGSLQVLASNQLDIQCEQQALIGFVLSNVKETKTQPKGYFQYNYNW